MTDVYIVYFCLSFPGIKNRASKAFLDLFLTKHFGNSTMKFSERFSEVLRMAILMLRQGFISDLVQ